VSFVITKRTLAIRDRRLGYFENLVTNSIVIKGTLKLEVFL